MQRFLAALLWRVLAAVFRAAHKYLMLLAAGLVSERASLGSVRAQAVEDAANSVFGVSKANDTKIVAALATRGQSAQKASCGPR